MVGMEHHSQPIRHVKKKWPAWIPPEVRKRHEEMIKRLRAFEQIHGKDFWRRKTMLIKFLNADDKQQVFDGFWDHVPPKGATLINSDGTHFEIVSHEYVVSDDRHVAYSELRVYVNKVESP
jgi:hypothetical protein